MLLPSTVAGKELQLLVVMPRLARVAPASSWGVYALAPFRGAAATTFLTPSQLPLPPHSTQQPSRHTPSSCIPHQISFRSSKIAQQLPSKSPQLLRVAPAHHNGSDNVSWYTALYASHCSVHWARAIYVDAKHAGRLYSSSCPQEEGTTQNKDLRPGRVADRDRVATDSHEPRFVTRKCHPSHHHNHINNFHNNNTSACSQPHDQKPQEGRRSERSRFATSQPRRQVAAGAAREAGAEEASRPRHSAPEERE
jgi:hypothetical protein